MTIPMYEQDQLTYRPVYLSDLKAIVNLYREQAPDGRYQYRQQQVAEDFGIPLNVVEHNKKTIAYSAICLNAEQEAHIELVLDKELGNETIARELELHSLNACRHAHLFMDEGDHFEIDKIRHATKTLIDWLNKC